MRTSELEGKYTRLRADLANAYAAPAWRSGYIDRLATELLEVERRLQALHGSSATRSIRESGNPPTVPAPRASMG